MTNKEKIEKSNQEQTEKFCPLIKGNCIQNCVCFESAKATEKYFLSAGCSNVLMEGAINVY